MKPFSTVLADSLTSTSWVFFFKLFTLAALQFLIRQIDPLLILYTKLLCHRSFNTIITPHIPTSKILTPK